MIDTLNVSKRKPPHLIMLVVLSAVTPLSLNIFMPSMPGIMQVFQIEYSTVMLTLTLFLTGTAVSQLFMGLLSDRFGRRPIVIYGMVLFLIGSALCIFATSIEMLIVGRVIQAVGGCAGMVMGRAIIRDMHGLEKSASMMGYVMMVMVVAPMLAPSIGGFLDIHYGWHASFIFVFVFTAIVLFFAWLLLGETHLGPYQAESPLVMFKSFGALLTNVRFVSPALQVGFSSAAFFAFVGVAPYVAIKLMGASSFEYGLYFMISAVSYMMGNLITGRTSEKWGPARLVALGLGCSLIGAMWLLVNHFLFGLTPLTLFCGMALFAFGNGLCLPSGMAKAISADTSRVGAAAGLSGFLQLGAGAVSSYLAGLLLTNSALPLIIIMTSCAVLATVSHVSGVWIEKRQVAVDSF